MACGGKLEPAADHRAVQHRHHRHLAEFESLEHAMPMREWCDAFGGVALGQFAQIEAGGEMLALAVQHDGLDVVRQRREEGLDAADGRVVDARCASAAATAAESRCRPSRSAVSEAGRS